MLNGCVPRPRQLTRGVFNTPHEPPVSCHGFHGFAKIHPLFPHTKERISGQSITLIFNTLDKDKPTHADSAIALQRLCRQISGPKSLK